MRYRLNHKLNHSASRAAREMIRKDGIVFIASRHLAAGSGTSVYVNLNCLAKINIGEGNRGPFACEISHSWTPVRASFRADIFVLLEFPCRARTICANQYAFAVHLPAAKFTFIAVAVFLDQNTFDGGLPILEFAFVTITVGVQLGTLPALLAGDKCAFVDFAVVKRLTAFAFNFSLDEIARKASIFGVTVR